MNTIVCPHCRKTVEISEAMTHQLREQVLKEQEEKHKLELEKAKKEAQLEAERKAKELSQKELEQSRIATKNLQEELMRVKKLQEEAETKAREEAQKKAQEEFTLKLKEKDKQIEQAKEEAQKIARTNEDLKRKLEQGSQQLQGEVLELDLEEKLRATFPGDEFLPVPKGVEGGDIWQKVMFRGKPVGSILWETKRTKAWSNGWLAKLKNDAARISASESIIVSTILPNGLSAFDRKEGVWVTTFEHAINICRFVRFLITSVDSIKSSASQTDEEWAKIRDYLMSDSFKHRMQSHFDNVKMLRENHEADKRATLIKWKKMESLINRLDENSIDFYGELKSIVSELPEVKGFESAFLTDGQETTEALL